MTGGQPRIGSGLDVHAFSDDPERPLILGGVTIPDGPGLAGHSDADVVAHAVADALLGAAGLGDLGSRFGVDDPATAGADSMGLLSRVVADVLGAGWSPVNADCTVVAQRPRLADHLDAMRTNLRDVLGAGVVSVKATSTDGLGAVGRGEGIACWAVCLLVGRSEPSTDDA
ncbi:MAG: 2-C-methyl-D-erythritol 2,4-cyclodiphosphate synthase [Actinobacteria bacterium]|nr:2-C-methyl-D-erythritol 2,4-cyclodiphosphate synthase [Actinomycetota bacterium]